ncbi:MAG: hypothetical protein ACRENG_10865 [bacterium]
MKARKLAVILIAAISLPAMAYAQAQGDSILYVDPKGQYKLVMPRQEVAGLDVEILAFHASLKKGSQPKCKDTSFVQFFVPDGYPLAVEIRQEKLLYALKPGIRGWSIGLFQCLGLLNSTLQPVRVEAWSAVGKGHQDVNGIQHISAVAWNGNTPDTLSHYEFKFMPNQDIEVIYSILQVIQPEDREHSVFISPKKFSPGNVPFTISWDGRIGEKPAPEGTYRLIVKGEIFLKSGGELDLFRPYAFYYKPIFTPCPKN